MQINMSLSLPRDEASIPVVRHICAKALQEISTLADCVHDIEVALTEACANVIEHSGVGDEYSVEVSIDDDVCVIRVLDNGPGFDASDVMGAKGDAISENGRGVRMMRALVDNVKFESKPRDGTVVSLEKRLEFDGPSALVAASKPRDRPA